MVQKVAQWLLACIIIACIGAILGLGFTSGRASDSRDPLSVLFSEQSTHDIETRLLMAYLGRVHNDATDDFTLDVWQYSVQRIDNEHGTFFVCESRSASGELPSVRYLDEYLSLGGKIYEDGSCGMTVIAP